MRASAAALHSCGQTVAGLGIGSVLLGYLSDRLADSNCAGDYAAICLAAKPGQAPAACAEAAATGLQHAMMAVGGFLLIAIINYIFAARSLPWRSEEHTSELQSLMRISYAAFCLKNKTITAPSCSTAVSTPDGYVAA